MVDVQRYAIIQGGIVENVCLWDGDLAKWQPPVGTIAVRLSDVDRVSAGDSYSAKEGFVSLDISQ